MPPQSAPAAVGAVLETLPLGEAIAEQQRRREARAADTAAANSSVRAPIATRRGRPRRAAHQDEAYQVIQAYIADFARELNDRASLRSSTMRAYNLYRRSGVSQEAFIAQLYAARAIVKEKASSIRAQGGTNAAGFAIKNKSPYFYAVLADLLNLGPEAPASANGQDPPLASEEPAPARSPRGRTGRT